jgi:C1A family cysteine protease
MKGAFVLATVAAAEPSFEEWKDMFQIQTNGAEEEMKVKYNANVASIQAMNAENNGATFAVNQFAAMDQADWKGYLNRSSARDKTDSPPVLGVHTHDGSELATSVNWVTKGAVTAVKDQGQCGGCWSFAATGGLEGANNIASGRLTSLAEQQFLDCDTSDSGCNGGLEYAGWNFFKSAHQGICTESSYPYTARDGSCKQSSCSVGLAAGAIAGVTHVQSGSASALQSALNSRPVAIGIQADQNAFQFYSGGVLTGTCGTNLDHSVLAVGYDTTNSYWLVKNSWGASWGEKGYVKLSMSGDKCGILDDASFPVVTASVEV